MPQYLPPLPPFNDVTAQSKIRQEEDALNTSQLPRAKPAYAVGTHWHITTSRWSRQRLYRLMMELEHADGAKIAVRYAYEWRDGEGGWVRSVGTEHWTFNEFGVMTHRHVRNHDTHITQDQRKFRWPLGARPANHPRLAELGL
ncbi:DUF1348 family protein [Pigmentiphaga aceris]|uniref:DUF1348 family protein n=1 Tax=Pigmentiphaga aceris TaxID=1940612 RepID=A0A5C0AVJ0_9BURK|nr:DUF1348 family protein [Pigmentiphaga aceris]QEI06452.1 DUF1348 family protein [Pigmentiphaga aceris]